jgi:predicted lipoprotein
LECLQTQSGDKLLSEAIAEKFEDISSQLAQIPDPMSETLMTNKPLVDDAYTQMQMTVPLIKHEMTTAFGVQINYDSGDGD